MDCAVTTVPLAPVPRPRRTTPLAAILIAVAIVYFPAFRSTAPRTPLASGRAETASMAAWIALVSSPPEGATVLATGTVGRGTPPPM